MNTVIGRSLGLAYQACYIVYKLRENTLGESNFIVKLETCKVKQCSGNFSCGIVGG